MSGNETCLCCGTSWTRKPRPQSRRNGANPNGSHGWCPRCYRRWLDHGRPAGPPPPRPPAAYGGGLCDEYAFMRSWGMTLGDAAARLGVTKRTAARYEARLAASRAATAGAPLSRAGAA